MSAQKNRQEYNQGQNDNVPKGHVSENGAPIVRLLEVPRARQLWCEFGELEVPDTERPELIAHFFGFKIS